MSNDLFDVFSLVSVLHWFSSAVVSSWNFFMVSSVLINDLSICFAMNSAISHLLSELFGHPVVFVCR